MTFVLHNLKRTDSMHNSPHCSGPSRPPSRAFSLFSTIVLTLLVFSVSACADELENLLHDLSAPQRAVRLAAEEKLIHLGPAILPKLPAGDQVADPAARDALLRIRQKIFDQLTRNALQASRVTLQGTYTLEEVIAEIRRQTGNRVEVSFPAHGKLTASRSLQIKDVPFWEALQKIAREFALRVACSPDRSFPVLFSSENSCSTPPLAIASQGPFLWIWESAELRPAPNSPGKNLLRAHLVFATEPRLRGLFATFSPGEMPLRTHDGKQLPPLNPDASFELPMGEGGHSVKCTVDYLLPHDSKPQKFNWQGNFSLLIAAGEERFELRPPQQKTGDSQRQGEVAVTFFPVQFEQVNNQGDTLRIPLALTYDKTGPAFESHRLWIFRNRAELILPPGNKLPTQDCETRLQQQNVVLMDYKFKLPKPFVEKSTFIYFAPTHIVSEHIPFEFKGVSPPLKSSALKPSETRE